jgi:biopolymer transport protein TolR
MSRHRARRQTGRRPMAEINVVPYIDVMLVLLIIFMITAPLLTAGVKVDLPQADADPIELEAAQPIIFSINQAGEYFITEAEGEISPVKDNLLLPRATALMQRRPTAPVLIKGDRSISYDQVVRLMVLLQQAGAASVGLLTDPGDV